MDDPRVSRTAFNYRSTPATSRLNTRNSRALSRNERRARMQTERASRRESVRNSRPSFRGARGEGDATARSRASRRYSREAARHSAIAEHQAGRIQSDVDRAAKPHLDRASDLSAKARREADIASDRRGVSRDFHRGRSRDYARGAQNEYRRLERDTSQASRSSVDRAQRQFQRTASIEAKSRRELDAAQQRAHSSYSDMSRPAQGRVRDSLRRSNEVQRDTNARVRGARRQLSAQRGAAERRAQDYRAQAAQDLRSASPSQRSRSPSPLDRSRRTQQSRYGGRTHVIQATPSNFGQR